jgi:hypothetical protein
MHNIVNIYNKNHNKSSQRSKKTNLLDKRCKYRLTTLSTNLVYKIILKHTHTYPKLLIFVLYKQVEGTMIASNAYPTPFEPISAICNSPACASALIKNEMFDYVTCNQRCPFIYKNFLSVFIRTMDKNNVQCITRETILHELLPRLKKCNMKCICKRKTKLFICCTISECMKKLH